MKQVDLGKAKTCEFDDYLILGFSKKWLMINNGKPLEFDAIVSENGELVLSASLGPEDRTNSSTGKADNNVM